MSSSLTVLVIIDWGAPAEAFVILTDSQSRRTCLWIIIIMEETIL